MIYHKLDSIHLHMSYYPKKLIISPYTSDDAPRKIFNKTHGQSRRTDRFPDSTKLLRRSYWIRLSEYLYIILDEWIEFKPLRVFYLRIFNGGPQPDLHSISTGHNWQPRPANILQIYLIILNRYIYVLHLFRLYMHACKVSYWYDK